MPLSQAELQLLRDITVECEMIGLLSNDPSKRQTYDQMHCRLLDLIERLTGKVELFKSKHIS